MNNPSYRFLKNVYSQASFIFPRLLTLCCFTTPSMITRVTGAATISTRPDGHTLQDGCTFLQATIEDQIFSSQPLDEGDPVICQFLLPIKLFYLVVLRIRLLDYTTSNYVTHDASHTQL
ncbi:unnamed protein product [Arctogadus glacialis]